MKTTWYAGRHRYEEMLQSGIRVYEYQPAMLHSKTLVADGAFSSVGSMNFDNRSMAGFRVYRIQFAVRSLHL